MITSLKPFIPSMLRKWLKNLRSKHRRYFGLNNLDRKLEKYLDISNGFFVELGANDGVTQSNTLHYERFKNWHGVLVEPTPHNYLLCLKNRSQRNHIFCNACVSFDYHEKFVEIIYSNLMSAPVGLESDLVDPYKHAEKGKTFLATSENTFTFGAVAKPLSALLDEAHAPQKIDLLSLDVEGAELEVLKGIDHAKYRFRFMCIESRDKQKLQTYLASVGYKMIDRLSSQDYLFADSAHELI